MPIRKGLLGPKEKLDLQIKIWHYLPGRIHQFQLSIGDPHDKGRTEWVCQDFAVGQPTGIL